MKKIAKDFKKDPKTFWKYINSKRKTNGIPNTMVYKGNSSSCPKQLREFFADSLRSAFRNSTSDQKLRYFPELKSVTMNSLVFSHADLLKNLSSVKINKGPGPDEIAPIILRNCANELCVHLYFICLTNL